MQKIFEGTGDAAAAEAAADSTPKFVFRAKRLMDRVSEIATSKFDMEKKSADDAQAEADKKERLGKQRFIEYTINTENIMKEPVKFSKLLTELNNNLAKPEFTSLFSESISAFGIEMPGISLVEGTTKKTGKPDDAGKDEAKGTDEEAPETTDPEKAKKLAANLLNALIAKITPAFEAAVKKHMERFSDVLGDEKPKFQVKAIRRGNLSVIQIMLLGGPDEYPKKLMKGLSSFIKENDLEYVLKEAKYIVKDNKIHA